jgi:hypothetical protein
VDYHLGTGEKRTVPIRIEAEASVVDDHDAGTFGTPSAAADLNRNAEARAAPEQLTWVTAQTLLVRVRSCTGAS